MESLWGHLVRLTLFLSGDVPLMFGLGSTMDLGDKDHTFDDE